MGHLDHSPADILRYLLIAHGIGTYPSGRSNPEWSIFVDNEPNSPDGVITVYNTIGRTLNRTQPDGQISEMHGIQVRVRSSLSDDGWAKIRTIAIELDEQTYQETVTIGSATYCVHSFSRTGQIIPFPGKDAETPTKRSIHVFNGLLTVVQKILGTGSYY